ncbi:hypothetical protein Axi01nite_86340 [Actinoplanes xinjiangensis]|nr:hypothetical protein Axi01nite_86340 [Actinoplanes xinjiangensis]
MFLVTEMVENRAAGHAGGLFEAVDRRAVVSESREARAGRAEDLVASSIELVLTHPGHTADRVMGQDFLAIRTYGLLEPAVARSDDANFVMLSAFC